MINEVATSIKMNPAFTGFKPTEKQLAWLRRANRELSLGIDFKTITTMGIASALIGKTQEQINKKEIVPVAPVTRIEAIFYCIIETGEEVFIKSFLGTKKTAVEKCKAKYGTSYSMSTTHLNYAKEYAIKAKAILATRKMHDEADKEEYKDEIAIQSLEVTASDLETLNLKELYELAHDMGVNLGNSKKASTIINRILASRVA